MKKFLVILGIALLAFLAAVIPAEGAAATNNPTPQSISAKALVDHECDDSELHFVITQVASADLAPASIHVTWDNGNEADVNLWKYTGKTAHYLTTDNLDALVVSATATIYGSWDGQFNLSHGPCEVPTTTTTVPPTTTTTVPPTTTTTQPPVTTTTVPPTTTTTVPPTTTTTVPETPVTTVTTEPVRTGTPVEVVPAPVVPAPVLDDELAFGGSWSALLATVGAVLASLGLFLRRLGRRS